MPNAIEIPPMRLDGIEPCGCHLQVIASVGGCFSFTSGAERFDAFLKKNHREGSSCYKGEYITGTLVSIADINKNEFDNTVAELKKRGFKCLGIQPGAHGKYKMHLYGLGFTIPKEKE